MDGQSNVLDRRSYAAEEDIFNVESSAATANMERAIRDEAIGSTLYSKTWVMQVVLGVSSTFEESAEKIASATDDFASLVEMSSNPDVAAFLHGSGCLDIFPGLIQSDHRRLCELAICILANVVSKKSVLKEMLESHTELLREPFRVLLERNSANDLIAVAKYLFALYKGLAAIFPENDLESDRDPPIEQCPFLLLLREDMIVGRLAFILAASMNDELLKALSKLLLVVFDLCLDRADEDKFMESPFVHPEFLLAMSSALHQSIRNYNTAFRLFEALGILVSQKPLEQHVAIKLCATVEAYLCTYSDTEYAVNLGLAVRICRDCWKVCSHEGSFKALQSFVQKARATLEGSGTEDEDLAFKCALAEQFIENVKKNTEAN